MPAVVEQYVRSVMSLIPRVYSDRERIEQDLRSHLADRVAAGATEQMAVDQMGPAVGRSSRQAAWQIRRRTP
jgi:hypothetical protein